MLTTPLVPAVSTGTRRSGCRESGVLMPPVARPWFRMYSDILDNQKVDLLSPVTLKVWLKLLALANLSKPRGSLPKLSLIAYRLRMDLSVVTSAIDELTTAGLVDQGEPPIMHDWDEWQKDRDVTPTRRLSQDSHANVTQSVTKITIEKDSDSDQEREEEKEVDPDRVRANRERLKPLLNLTTDEWQTIHASFTGRGDINARFMEWVDWIGESEEKRWPKKGNLVAFTGFLNKPRRVEYSAAREPPTYLREVPTLAGLAEA